MNKYLMILLLLTGCSIKSNYDLKDNFRVGMIVTNGYCTGQIVKLLTSEAELNTPVCGSSTYERIWIEYKELREIK